MPQATKRTLTTHHASYQPDVWECYKALYEGGQTLLQSPRLATLFPPNVGEHGEVYKQRIARLVYANYAGLICRGHIVTIFGDPLQVERNPDTVGGEYYSDFLADASAAGGARTPWADVLAEQLANAMVCQGAWTRVRLPEPNTDEVLSRADQEKAGQLNAYVTPYPPECLTNWHQTDDGRLQWLLIRGIAGTDKFGSADKEPVHVFELWTDNEVTEWRISDKEWKDAGPDATFEGTAQVNVYGRIPFIRMEFPQPLWLMDQLYTLARELLNKHSALAWAEYRALFPFLVVYVKNEMVNVDGGVEAGSANTISAMLRKPKGPGYAWVLAVDEKAEYVAPPTDVFEFCLKAIETRKVELARTVYALNVAADLSAGSQRRTAESKVLDIESSKPFLQYLGSIARDHTQQVHELLAHMRGDQVEFVVTGLEHVQPLDVQALIDNAVGISAVDLPSKTLKIEHGVKVARGLLGHEATEALVDQIRKELEEGYAHEDEVPPQMPMTPADNEED